MKNQTAYLSAVVMMSLIFACTDENPATIPSEGTTYNPSSSAQETKVYSSTVKEESSSSEIILFSSSSSYHFSSSTIVPTSSSEYNFHGWEPYSYGELIDERDGQVYKTIKIGEQTWMAENLKYKDSLFTWGEAIDQKNLLKGNGDNCSDIKRLYYYPCNNIPYIGAKGVCPESWHIPTKKEQADLIQYANKSPEKFDTIVHYWLFGGVEKNIPDISSHFFYFWISEESDTNNTNYYIGPSETEAFVFSFTKKRIQQEILRKSTKISIRCVKDKAAPTIELGQITDERDGQIYKTVKIGEQTWMAENLNYDDSISQCYNNELDNCTKYGRLYSWDATMNCRLFESIGDCYQHHYNNYELGIVSRGICPIGWHIPSDRELSNISALIHKNSNAIKSNYGWNNDKNGYDILGLNILPAGSYTLNKNLWIDMGESSCFWTTLQSAIALSFYSEKSEVVPQNEAFVYCISSQNQKIIENYVSKSNAYSIRCVKDSSTAE